MADIASNIWRDFETDGVPGSGKHLPKKSEIREWGAWVESVFTAVLASGGKLYTSKADMDADLVPAANTPALVIGDATPSNNGLYAKVGGTGTGSWTRVSDVPGTSFIRAQNVGAGTANAIVATTALPVPSADGGALIALPIYEANTDSAVTVAFNGGSALTILTAAGNAPAVGGLAAGMAVAGYKVGGNFRLLSDQASAAIQAAAEAAQLAAEAAQAAAEAAQVGAEAAETGAQAAQAAAEAAQAAAEAAITVISLPEQGSDPATPGAGTVKVYAKTDKKVYSKNSDGTVVDLGASSGGGSGGSFRDDALAAARLARAASDRIFTPRGFADAFVTDAGIESGSSSNYTYNNQDDDADNLIAVGAVSNTLTTNDTATGINFRQRFAAALFSVAGSKIRLHFTGSTAIDSNIGPVYVGHGASAGDAYDFEAAPTQVTFQGGNASAVIPAGDTFASDLIDFDYDDTKPLLVAMYQSGTGTGTRYADPGANYAQYHKIASDETSVVDATGYTTTANRLRLISAVSIFDNGAMVLVLSSRTLQYVPASVSVLLNALIDGSATLNADVIVEVSRDGGTTWTAGTLAEVDALEDGTKLYEATGINVGAQPSGQALAARVRTPNAHATTVKSIVVEGEQ